MPKVHRPVDPNYGLRMAILPGVFGCKEDAEFAALLGISKGRFHHYKGGASKPREDVMDRLAALGIDANYIWLGRLDGLNEELRLKIASALEAERARKRTE